MTATQATEVRLTRTSSALLLPLLLIMILTGVGVALASVAPSRVTSGIYQVIIGEGPARVTIPRVTIPTESLGCEPAGDRARCTVAVAGQPLVISIQYTGFDSTCRAQHGERMVPCLSGLGDYGQASHTVWISDGLGVSEQERAQIRTSTPWWRTADGLSDAALAVLLTLTAAAAIAAAAMGRRAQEHPRRMAMALGIGILGLILFPASGLIIAPDRAITWPMLFSPLTWVPAVALGAWQYQLAGTGTRRAKTAGAALATATYCAAAAFVFLLHSGFIG